MKVMLIVKGKRLDALKSAKEHLPTCPDFEASNTSPNLDRFGHVRIDCMLLSSEVEKVYWWFNEGPIEGEMPSGTLLFFTVSP